MRNTLLIGVTLVIFLALGELLLRFFTPFPIHEGSNIVFDGRLGYHLDPALPDVDAQGFRNPAGRADAHALVAIGDSHTYGINVDSAQSWPRVFEEDTGIPVYNEGVSSYGILTYHALVQAALASGAQTIVALYPANDFFDGFSYCDIRRQQAPYWDQETTRLGLTFPPVPEWCKDPKRTNNPVQYFILNIDDIAKSKVATISALNHLVYSKIMRAIKGGQKDKYYEFKEELPPLLKLRIDVHANREANLEKAGVRHQVDVFRRLVADWSRQAAPGQLGILILPSRERVYAVWLARFDREPLASPRFLEQVAVEARLTTVLRKIVAETSLPLVSALPEMVNALEESRQEGEDLYPPTDGHPFAQGYVAYARAAERLYAKMQTAASSL